MSDSLFIIIPLLVVFKIIIWGFICYRRSERYRAAQQFNGGRVIVAQPTTIIHRTVVHGPPDNGISGIENPGYVQQPPPYTTVVGPYPSQSSAPPSYEQVTKQQYNMEPRTE